MIRRKVRLPSRVDSIATAFAGDLRARYADQPWMAPLLRPAERIERGETVVVPDWRLRRYGVRPGPSHYVQLGADGEVEYVVPVRDGIHIVGWRPVG